MHFSEILDELVEEGFGILMDKKLAGITADLFVKAFPDDLSAESDIFIHVTHDNYNAKYHDLSKVESNRVSYR